MSGSSKLPTVPHLTSVLLESNKLFSETLKYLVKHLSDGGPSTTLATITPLCRLAVLEKATWLIMHKFHSLLSSAGWTIRHAGAFDNDAFLQIANTCQLARKEIVPVIEKYLDRIEMPLMTELRGSYGLETFLRFIKQISGFWSVRIDLLDDIPEIISLLYSSCGAMMSCLDCVEQYSRLLQTRFKDTEWVSLHQDRPNLIWCLDATECSVENSLSGLICETYVPWYVNLSHFARLFSEYYLFSRSHYYY